VRGEVEIRTPREAADAGLLSPELAEHARVRSDWRLVRNGSRRDRRRAEIDGADDGGITGTMNGVTFRYYAVPSYRELVAEHGFVLVDVHDDPGVSTYFLARRSW
jgi:hypothetical protein